MVHSATYALAIPHAPTARAAFRPLRARAPGHAPALTLVARACDSIFPMRVERSPDLRRAAEVQAQLGALEPFLRMVAARLCKDPDAAKDLVQDTCERALVKVEKFSPDTNLKAWLATLMHHIFIDNCRARKRRPPADCIDDFQVAQPDADSAPWWGHVTVDDLRRATQLLEDKFREVYELHTFAKLSYEHIAKRLDIQKMTVGTRLLRARQKLREILESQRTKEVSP